jgi:death on curing protein
MSSALLFLQTSEVLFLHTRLIQTSGGMPGLRDRGALEAALAAPQQRAHYEAADALCCAATYAYHLSQAHAFLDGNKRVAAAATELFLELNGLTLPATDRELIDLFMQIAANMLSRDSVEQLLRLWMDRKL